MGGLQLAVCAVVVMCAVAGSVYSARYHVKRDAGQVTDAVFWDGFAGLVIVFPAVVVPSLASPWWGLAMGAIALLTGVAAYVWSPKSMAWLESRRQRLERASAVEGTTLRHRTVLARWRRYELDPALGIEYPDMADVRRPETAALIKAMKAAERLGGPTDAGYAPAVTRLEEALAAAERAAGVPPTDAAPAAAPPAVQPAVRAAVEPAVRPARDLAATDPAPANPLSRFHHHAYGYASPWT
jgi:hypothetical protein